MKAPDNSSPSPSTPKEGDHKRQVISKIEEGVVIDHIPSPRALKIARLIHLEKLAKSHPQQITLGLNLPTSRKGRKDILKIAHWTLTREQEELVGLVCPEATINIIKNYQVEEKKTLSIPSSVGDVLLCPDRNCITHYEEIPGRFKVIRKAPLTVQCQYCETPFYDKLIKFK